MKGAEGSVLCKVWSSGMDPNFDFGLRIKISNVCGKEEA